MKGAGQTLVLPVVPLSISELLPIGSTSGVGTEWSKGKAEFHQSATGVKGLRRLDIKEVCFGCVVFVDIGGLVSCSDCFGLLLLSDRRTILQCLDRFFCMTVTNVGSTDKVSLWPVCMERNKTKFIVRFMP